MRSIKVGFRGKIIPLEVRELSKFEIYRGLMFKGSNCDNLLFNRRGKWGIHSFFVFFPFLALWLDERNNVIERKIVKPFSFHVAPREEFARLVEIPVNWKNMNIINFFKNG